MKNTIKVAYTHAGTFHSDDVFSAALLGLVYSRIKIIRTFKVPEDAELVFDIGLGKYDHHQSEAEIRPNGIKYASFGLLWREFGHLFVTDVKSFDKNFIEALDLSDNTGIKNPISNLIGAFNPSWSSGVSENDAFIQAVEFATGILQREFARIQSVEKASSLVREYLKKSENGIVVMEKFVPWQQVLVPEKNADFIVYPAQRGGWNAQQIPTKLGGVDAKVFFPKNWYATSEIFKIETGGTFCHASGFLCAFNTKEEAINACEIAINRN